MSAYPYADLRLFRTLVNTEITVFSTRFNFNNVTWTEVPSGELDENGESIPAGWTNDGNVVFPKPGPLDLLAVLNHVRLYAGLGDPRVHIGSSPPVDLNPYILNDEVVFTPGQLTITLF